MSGQNSSRGQVGIYVLLVFVFSSIFYFMALRADNLGGGAGMYVLGLMWCPALAAMTTLKVNGRDLAELGWKWPEKKYALGSWLIPLCYAAIAYLIVWCAGLGGFANHEFMDKLVGVMGLHASPAVSTALYVLLAGSFGLAKSLASSLGEEIGWRGFLVPQLFKSVGFTGTALISGVVWSCWHYPLLIWGHYNGGETPTWYSLTCFTVMVMAISVVFAWMRLKSGSLWTGALLHASHNLYVQAIFTPLTRNTGKTSWYIDEFGAVLPVVAVGFAIYFWTRRKELEQTAQSASLLQRTSLPESEPGYKGSVV